ncbi:hypothetical protein M514_20074 [Trichuris suis]|uniref:Uncharacterized protein n=1 Tax=Trichuris suis TaxID=68888 RepID=A0A085NE83_9BILA|nr:hypothetical protein M514_20074 [Trichuris suis]
MSYMQSLFGSLFQRDNVNHNSLHPQPICGVEGYPSKVDVPFAYPSRNADQSFGFNGDAGGAYSKEKFQSFCVIYKNFVFVKLIRRTVVQIEDYTNGFVFTVIELYKSPTDE